ncbi:START domain-containing protein [Mucilaginibacter sp. X4EP1]|uniref:START domain-containing protein n=1 Tax=Mucilaginibacter sp. X4EP1 TaxID=2723092 RepID=UPI0038F792BD
MAGFKPGLCCSFNLKRKRTNQDDNHRRSRSCRFCPRKKSTVRINNSVGEWIITPVDNNQVRVEYALHVDPAGSFPSWLVNMFSGETPMQIFENLRQELKHSAQRNTTPMLTSAK